MGLQIENLSKQYGKSPVLKNINLHLKKGEIVGFLGPNGAGKTTLMKILTGSLNRWEGRVFFDELNLKTQLQDVQKHVGYLPENNPLYTEMYVKEYLYFIANTYKLSNVNYPELLQKSGLTDHQNKPIKTLSKGYKQRVGLAAALIHNPPFLILDEPTTGLDPNQLIEIRKLIKTLGQEKTVFLSTHILQEVEALCDRVIILHQGQIVLDSPLKDLADQKQQIVKVTFDFRVETEALKRLPQVSRVVNTHDFDYEIYFDTPNDQRPVVFDFAHDNGLKILSLQHKIENLEKRFYALTQGK